MHRVQRSPASKAGNCSRLSTTASAPALAYPATERGDTVDPQFGVNVADPYRWLEDDVRVNPKVAAWVAEQNKVTDAYLVALARKHAGRLATFDQGLAALHPDAVELVE